MAPPLLLGVHAASLKACRKQMLESIFTFTISLYRFLLVTKKRYGCRSFAKVKWPNTNFHEGEGGLVDDGTKGTIPLPNGKKPHLY